jgi:hypothetical protein
LESVVWVDKGARGARVAARPLLEIGSCATQICFDSLLYPKDGIVATTGKDLRGQVFDRGCGYLIGALNCSDEGQIISSHQTLVWSSCRRHCRIFAAMYHKVADAPEEKDKPRHNRTKRDCKPAEAQQSRAGTDPNRTTHPG